MTFEEYTRRTIFALVWAVLVIRTPQAIRNKQQWPLLNVLLVIAVGSIAIQSWFADWINQITGVNQVNNLIQGLIAVADCAVVWNLMAYLGGNEDGQRSSARAYWSRTCLAAGTVLGMTIFWFATPPELRYKATYGTFAGYNLLIFSYLLVASCAATFMVWGRLGEIRDRALYLGLMAVTIGNAFEAPFAVIRIIERLGFSADSDLRMIAFLASSIRFLLVSAGVLLVAGKPLFEAGIYNYRRIRLYTIWRRLRDATPQIVQVPPQSRNRDLLPVSDPWERLHRRVVETYDSIYFLRDRWSWPDLLAKAEMAADKAAVGKKREMATACWLEVALRLAYSGAVKSGHGESKMPLRKTVSAESTMRAETRYLLTLNRALGSRCVANFAGEVVTGLVREETGSESGGGAA